LPHLLVFVFLLQRWSQSGHGGIQQQKEKTVILPFFLGCPAAGLLLASSTVQDSVIQLLQLYQDDAYPSKVLLASFTTIPEDAYPSKILPPASSTVQ
jgi:hypothetical protein